MWLVGEIRPLVDIGDQVANIEDKLNVVILKNRKPKTTVLAAMLAPTTASHVGAHYMHTASVQTGTLHGRKHTCKVNNCHIIKGHFNLTNILIQRMVETFMSTERSLFQMKGGQW